MKQFEYKVYTKTPFKFLKNFLHKVVFLNIF